MRRKRPMRARSFCLPAAALGLTACNAVFGIQGGTPFETSSTGSAGGGTGGTAPALTGDFLWAKQSGTKMGDDTVANGVAFDGSGNVLLTGAYTGDPAFGLSPLP